VRTLERLCAGGGGSIAAIVTEEGACELNADVTPPSDLDVAVIGMASLSGASSSALSVMARLEEPVISCRARVRYAVAVIITMNPMTIARLAARPSLSTIAARTEDSDNLGYL
jgi:hypothetical protein